MRILGKCLPKGGKHVPVMKFDFKKWKLCAFPFFPPSFSPISNLFFLLAPSAPLQLQTLSPLLFFLLHGCESIETLFLGRKIFPLPIIFELRRPRSGGLNFWLLNPIDLDKRFLSSPTTSMVALVADPVVIIQPAAGKSFNNVQIWSLHPPSRVCLMDPTSILISWGFSLFCFVVFSLIIVVVIFSF